MIMIRRIGVLVVVVVVASSNTECDTVCTPYLSYDQGV